jgi:hypothetical protein
MSFDNSRFPFDPARNYSGVVMEQGRVQLDSDWNEWLAELARRTQAGTLDILGRAVYPATTPFAFQITATTDASGVNHVSIGPGRMYVDGLLAENHGAASSMQWDPALAELSGSPQPPGSSATGTTDYTAQPYLPNAALPAGNGPFLAYLDVWIRPVTYLEDPSLIDPAVNVDTTGRLQTIWQVKLAPVPAGSTCSATPWPGPSIGQLTTGYVGSTPSGPCCLTNNTGYTGMENQFYRVEIHQPGTPATGGTLTAAAAGSATFKWSRDNRSVETGVTAILSVTNVLGNPASQLTVLSLGRDQVLGFAPGNWIEILDDDLELNGQPGELHQIDSVDFSAKTITLVNTLVTPANFPVDANNQTTPQRHTRIRRWDQSAQIFKSDNTLWVDLGAAGATGDIPVPPPETTLILESGITVTFGPNGTTTFNTGNFWTFAERPSDSQFDILTNAPPRGIHHHYAPLSVVTFSPPAASECRTEWPPSSEGSCCCCTYTVGANAQYQSIQSAINALPASGGEICILPGRYSEAVFINSLQDVVIHGCGSETRLASPSLGPNPPAPPAPQVAGSNTMTAVISIANSQNIQLRDFVVEAADGDVGILIDGTGNLIVPPPENGTTQIFAARKKFDADIHADTNIAYEYFPEVTNVTVENLFLTASTMPTILAAEVEVLRIRENRIAMADRYSPFPAVWLSGGQIEFVRNWVGLQTIINRYEWFPAIVDTDLSSNAVFGVKPSGKHPGGIQIAGPSSGVLVAENKIVGGSRNGITLGSFTILDGNQNDTGIVAGVTFAEPDAGATTNALLSPTTYPGVEGSTVVAGGLLSQIQIDRNTITNSGLCGIGPIGFFDLGTVLEVIAVEGLTITGNTITDTVQNAILDESAATTRGYGAISLPTVENLIVRDNFLTNFGNQPGLRVSGIYLLHGEMVDISRNQILDNRDWSDEGGVNTEGEPRDTTAAVSIQVVTPPTLDNTNTLASLLLYQPGMPALRLQENVIRIPSGLALSAIGWGPFTITNNHFSCGGNIPGKLNTRDTCVEILNLGLGLDFYFSLLPSALYAAATSATPSAVNTPNFLSSNGAVVFTNNVCQLELREVHQIGLASVIILTLDHLVFSNNYCWVDAGLFGVLVDAFLLAASLQVTSNRFQEGLLSVLLSGWTVGVFNITSQNISTYCLSVESNNPINNNNLMMFPGLEQAFCQRLIGQ